MPSPFRFHVARIDRNDSLGNTPGKIKGVQCKTCGMEWNYTIQSFAELGNRFPLAGRWRTGIRHDHGSVAAATILWILEVNVSGHLRKSEGPSPSSNLDAKTGSNRSCRNHSPDSQERKRIC